MDSLVSHLEFLIEEVEANLKGHPYSPSENDYENEDGVRIYNEKFIVDMPTDFAILLGRFGSLVEIKARLEQELEQDAPEGFADFLGQQSPRFKFNNE